MAEAKPTFWRRCRRFGRWCRLGLLWTLLSLTAALIYLNQIGLPNFLKASLQSELRAQGIDLEFERLRLRWFVGIVAESVNLGSSRLEHGPQFYVDEVQIHVNSSRLFRRRLDVESLSLRRGKLALPIGTPRQPNEQFVVDGIMTSLKFLPDGRWELDQFQANCLGARLILSGSVTNAAALRRSRPAGQGPRVAGAWWENPLLQSILRQANRIAGSLQFSNIPTLNLVVAGDAREPTTFHARLSLNATGAQTPWGTLDTLLLTTQLNQQPATNQLSRSEIHLQAVTAHTPWGAMNRLDISASVLQSFTNPVPERVVWTVAADQVRTPWLDVPQVRLTAQTTRDDAAVTLLRTEGSLQADVCQTRRVRLGPSDLRFVTVHVLTNSIPLEATWQGSLRNLEAEGLGTDSVAFSGRLVHSTASADAAWGPWAALAPFAIDLEARTASLATAGVSAQELALAATWRPPLLKLDRLEGKLLDGSVSLTANLDVATRAAAVSGNLDLDAHRVAPLINREAVRWLGQFAWERPPDIHVSAQATLPDWKTPTEHWVAELLPTLKGEGSFQGTNVAYQGVSALSARSHVQFSDGTLRLIGLHAERPEGHLDAAYELNLATRDFHWQIHHASIDPQAIRPALEPGAARALDFFAFATPPVISGEVRGSYRNLKALGFNAQVALTNVTIRDQTLDEVRADLSFTNLHLVGTRVVVRRQGQETLAESVGFNLPAEMLYFTNVVGHMDPLIITRIIGPKTTASIEPYRFLDPPEILLNGRIATRGNLDDDAVFDIRGGAFTWWRFRFPEVQGRLHWKGTSLSITNLDAGFYGGRLTGDLFATLPRDESSQIAFHARATGADLHEMMNDLSTETNRLEGRLDATLNVDSLLTDDWGSWQGRGEATLRDGFLWDWPLFGLFSPILNGVVPGLGSSRATAGTATYTITNSLIHTTDMAIRTLTMRLDYEGTVDFEGRLDAKVEAKLLRDAGLLGRIFSFATTPLTKIFVYKVTGTLGEPLAEPLHVPKILLIPLQPIQTLKNIFKPSRPK